MAIKAPRYLREIYYAGTNKVVPIGRKGQQSCTTLPESVQDTRDQIKLGPNSGGEQFARGAGDEFILNNPCELKYYLNGKLIKHLK